MRNRRLGPLCLSGLLVLSVSAGVVCGGEGTGKAGELKPPGRVVKIGAVAYSPSAVTIFDGVRRYLSRNGLTADYVLYSNYDSLVDALRNVKSISPGTLRWRMPSITKRPAVRARRWSCATSIAMFARC